MTEFQSLIQLNGHVYLVDKKAPIRAGDWFYNNHNKSVTVAGLNTAQNWEKNMTYGLNNETHLRDNYWKVIGSDAIPDLPLPADIRGKVVGKKFNF
jgi:hypothetical protein